MVVFFLRKCVQTTAKTMVVDRKKNPLALLYLVFEGLKGKFHNLKFLPNPPK